MASCDGSTTITIAIGNGDMPDSIHCLRGSLQWCFATGSSSKRGFLPVFLLVI